MKVEKDYEEFLSLLNKHSANTASSVLLLSHFMPILDTPKTSTSLSIPAKRMLKGFL
jgi:hypothetical protein